MRVTNTIAAIILIASVSGCASSRKHSKRVIMDAGKSMPNAAQAPLRDLNMRKEKIPQVLVNIKYPYRIDGPVYCDRLSAEITSLDRVLGPDDDVKKLRLSRDERAAEEASNLAQNALEDAATGWIPYRSVIRRVTGATKYERKVRNAYERGRVRRAFLKGVGGAFKCAYPAAPSSIHGPVYKPG